MNAKKTDKVLSKQQDRGSVQDPIRRRDKSIYMENHIAYLVGRLIGGNSATGGVISEGSSYFREGLIAIFGEYTAHNCYAGSDIEACKNLW